MARLGVTVERIVEIIKELESQGIDPTVTAVRERLGTGSFSTIGAVLSDWRQKKASEVRPAVPDAPDGVRHLFTQLWGEAWDAATRVHEPERQAIAHERQVYERAKVEMLSEIARLEAELDRRAEEAAQVQAGLLAERDGFRAQLDEVRSSLSAAEGALTEARMRIEEEERRTTSFPSGSWSRPQRLKAWPLSGRPRSRP